jgi:hypothetical protein
MTGHDLQITRLSQYWRRAIRAGHAYAEVSERFRGSNDPSWELDRRRNIMRGSFWILSFITVIFASTRFGLVPVALWFVFLMLLSLRSAWKARWKTGNWVTLLLFGFHSHLQQFPICVGQLEYELGKRRGKAKTLIEYKNTPSD